MTQLNPEYYLSVATDAVAIARDAILYAALTRKMPIKHRSLLDILHSLPQDVQQNVAEAVKARFAEENAENEGIESRDLQRRIADIDHLLDLQEELNKIRSSSKNSQEDL